MPVVTLGDLKNSVYARVEGNDAFYPQEEVIDAINDGIRTLNLLTGFLQATQTFTTVAGQGVYDTPSGILIPQRVSFNGRYLSKVPIQKACESSRKWISETTAELGRPVEYWVPIGINKIALVPIDAAGGNTVSVTGVAEPAALNDDSDTIAYPSEFGDVIAEYATHILMMKAGGLMSKGAMTFYQSFVKRVADLKRYRAKIQPAFRIEAEIQQ